METSSALGAYSAVFQSLTPGQDIFVERSVYFGPNLEGSTVGTATKSLNDTWYFAEGSRGGEYFANYFLLFNPTQNPITVNATFFPSYGGAVVRSFTIAPQARYTVSAADIDELAGKDFSSTFTGRRPVRRRARDVLGQPVARRHGEHGGDRLQSRWLFAEGVANSVMETFYLILNPNDFPIQVTAVYYPEYTGAFTQTFTIEPKSRYTVYLNGTAGEIGPPPRTSPVRRTSSPNAPSTGGDVSRAPNVIGVNAPAMVWSLPEGSDGALFDTYTLIANPNYVDVTLDITFFFDDGTQVTRARGSAADRARARPIDDGHEQRLAAAAGERRTAPAGGPLVLDAHQRVPADRADRGRARALLELPARHPVAQRRRVRRHSALPPARRHAPRTPRSFDLDARA